MKLSNCLTRSSGNHDMNHESGKLRERKEVEDANDDHDYDNNDNSDNNALEPF